RQEMHFGEYYQNLVRELGIDTGPLTAELRVPPAKSDAAKTLLQARGWMPPQTLIALAPGAAFGHAKRWPPKRFAALADLLASDLGAACVLLGREDDRDAGTALEASIGSKPATRLSTLIGETDLQRGTCVVEAIALLSASGERV